MVAKSGHYKQKWTNLLSYIIFSFGNLGPIILMWFMRDAYEANLLAHGKSAEYIARVMLDFTWECTLVVNDHYFNSSYQWSVWSIYASALF